MSGSAGPDSPEFKEWAALKMAEILSLEERGKAAAASPPQELRDISDVVDQQVMPIMETFGIPITKDELTKMFVDWFVRRTPQAPEISQGPHTSEEDSGSAPAWIGGRFGYMVRPMFRLAKVNTLRGLLKRTTRSVLTVAMLLPLILLPAYFFLSTLPVPALSPNSGPSQPGVAVGNPMATLTLDPSSPLIGLGQTQNYSLLTVNATSFQTTSPIVLSAFSPKGLSIQLSQTRFSSRESASVPVAITASSSIAVGSYSVTVEERSGASSRNQTFTILVVPALVVMEHLSYVPGILNVTKGTTVYWMNLDSTIGCCDPGYHNVVFGSGLNASSPILRRLGVWAYTFDAPGEFYYMCSIHPFMAGEVVVSA